MKTREELVKEVIEANYRFMETEKALKEFDQDPNSKFTLRDQLVKEVEEAKKVFFEKERAWKNTISPIVLLKAHLADWISGVSNEEA